MTDSNSKETLKVTNSENQDVIKLLDEIRVVHSNYKNLSHSKKNLYLKLLKTMSEEADKALK